MTATMIRIPLLAVCASLAWSCAPFGAGSVKADAERVITLQRNGEPGDDANISDAFGRIKPVDLASGKLKSYDTRTLELLFEATAVAADIRHRPELSRVMEDIFQEAVSRGFVGDMIGQLHRRYVGERRWTEARTLYERFPSKERRLPEIVEPTSVPLGGPAAYAVSPDGGRLTLEAVDLVSRPLIVTVVDVGCHFSRDADAAIAADPALAAAFAANSVEIYPAHYDLDAEEIAETNRTGKRSVKILYKASGWNGLIFNGTPHFYFLKGGKVVDEIEGMRPKSFAAELRRGVARLELKP